METVKISLGAAGLLLSLLLALPPLVWGHCDTLEGPVVVDAKAALAKGDITPVLKWIPAKQEGEVRDAFVKTLVVRGKGKEAQELGKVDGLVKLVVETVEKGIRHRFEETVERKKHAEHDVEHGRAYVASYVEFIHYGERIYQAAAHPPSHHAEGAAPAAHAH
ncbi:MAG: hypothetical protein HY814_07160 [Candidatus Riflebacteria bacterium]|nr:hypothetical protein [Candidatus Riflebacteria bacterium]